MPISEVRTDVLKRELCESVICSCALGWAKKRWNWLASLRKNIERTIAENV